MDGGGDSEHHGHAEDYANASDEDYDERASDSDIVSEVEEDVNYIHNHKILSSDEDGLVDVTVVGDVL